MSREFKFFIYLLERYAESRGVTADVMLNRLKANGLLDYAIGMYELYHVESIENAFADLDSKLAPRYLGASSPPPHRPAHNPQS